MNSHERLSLGTSNIHVSEFKSSPWDRLRKIGLLAVVCVFLAVFFYYLTAQVQLGTAHATNPDADWKSESR
jgi:hypothetical protein